MISIVKYHKFSFDNRVNNDIFFGTVQFAFFITILKELCKASTCTSLVSANISDVMDNNGKSSISSQHDKLSSSVAFTEGRYNHPL